MAKGKKHTAEQIVSLLRQIEVAVANGKTTPIACREGGITEQTYYRWRKEFGGLQVDQARRLKELEQENAKLKRLVSELSRKRVVWAVLMNGVRVMYPQSVMWIVSVRGTHLLTAEYL